MKFFLSIAAFVFLVPAAVWLTPGALEHERRSDVQPGSGSREGSDRPDSEAFVSLRGRNPVTPQVAVGEARDVIVARDSTRQSLRVAASTSPETRRARISRGRAMSRFGSPPVVSSADFKRRGSVTATKASIFSSPAQPAVWVDLGDSSQLTLSQQDEIQDAATVLHDQISNSGLDPESPEYRELWDEAVTDSDRIFRQRYGGQAWMRHHVAAFHMAHPTQTEAR